MFVEGTSKTYYIPANSVSSTNVELLAINAAVADITTISEEKVCIFSDSRSALPLLNNISHQIISTE